MTIGRSNTLVKNQNIRNMIYGLDTPVMPYNNKLIPAINFDNAATTPPFKQVVNEINHQLLYYGSIGRGMGQKSEHSSKLYSDSRSIVKDFVGADDDKYTIFYVNCTTDGMNKLASALIESPNDIILTTRMEHHANDLPWRERAKTVYAEVDEKGRLIVDDVERILIKYQGRIKYVSVTAASNVTGYVNDVHHIAKIAHRYGALIIVDGAQIAAHRKFFMIGNTTEEDIDFFVFSAHKMYSPFGCGAVIGLEDVLNKHKPKFFGGGMVESVYDNNVCYTTAPDLYEAGSPNYPGLIGMLNAMMILKHIGFNYIEDHERLLLKKTIDIMKNIPGVILYGDNDNINDRIGIIVFNLNGIEPEDTASMLSRYKAIAVRHAAFCAHPYVRRLANELEVQDCKDLLCLPPRGMVRISFGIYNTEEEVYQFIKTLKKILSLNPPKNIQVKKATTDTKRDNYILPYDRG